MGADKEGVKMIERLAEASKNVTPVLGDKFVKDLPELSGTFKDAFDTVLKGTALPGDVVFQAQRTGQSKIGNWFLPIKPMDVLHAESLANIAKWGTDASQIKAFVFTEKVSGYAGKIAGGEGHQFFIPHDVPLDKVLQEVTF